MKNEISGLYKCSSCGDELGSVTLVYCEECSKKLLSCQECSEVVLSADREILRKLEELLADTFRLYEMNGRQDYDSGVYSGVKRSIEEVRRCMAD